MGFQLPLGLSDLLSHPAVQQALTQQASMSADQAPVESQGEDMVAEARPIHKGIFGIHGTARNILGVLGDAFLTQAGHKPIYAEARDREKMSDALGGSQDFMTNPLAAIKKLNDAGYPEQAQELFKNYATLEATTTAKQSQAALDAARLEDVRSRGYGILGAMANPRSLNEKTFAQMVPIMIAKAQRSGIDIPPPPKDWASGGKEWAEQIERMGIDPYKGNRLDQIDEGLGIQNRNAATNERRLNVTAVLGGGNLMQKGFENTNRAMTPEELADFPGATSGTVTAGGKFAPHYPGGKGGKSFGGASGGVPSSIPPPRHAGDRATVNGVKLVEKGGKWAKAQ